MYCICIFDICGEDSRYAYCIQSKPFVVFFYTAIKYSKLKKLNKWMKFPLVDSTPVRGRVKTFSHKNPIGYDSLQFICLGWLPKVEYYTIYADNLLMLAQEYKVHTI